MKILWAILGSMGFGALLMYIFDPNSGNERRALVRDKAVGLTHDIQETVDKTTKDLSSRAKGLIDDAKSAISGKGTEDESLSQTAKSRGDQASAQTA